MQSTSISTGTKIVFWAVIIVMVLGSIVSFSAFSFQSQSQQNVNNIPAVKSNINVEKSLSGIVRKYDASGKTMYLLEVAGTPLAILTSSDPKIKFDKFVDKNVKLQGKGNSASGGQDTAAVLDVSKIELGS